MSRFAILLSGDLTVTPRLHRQIAGVRIIAADSGMKHARELGVMPELWVGDFDSSGSELLLNYAHVPRQTHPSEKELTDGELAVIEALRFGATAITLLGGFGGQSDHVTAHLGLSLRLAEAGYQCFISSGIEEAYPLVPGSYEFECSPKTRLSIVPWSDITGFNLNGVKWPLKNKNLTVGSSLTISNIVLGKVKLSLDSGTAIAFVYPLDPD